MVEFLTITPSYYYGNYSGGMGGGGGATVVNPTIYRFDKETGETWKLTDNVWVKIKECGCPVCDK